MRQGHIDNLILNCSSLKLRFKVKMLELKANCIIFLIISISFEVSSSFKCEFKAINDLATPGYICYIKSIVGKEIHVPGKSDNDVRMVGIKKIQNLSKLTQSEYPICQRFPNLKIVHIVSIESIEDNMLNHCKNLTIADLSNNKIQQVPENFYAENPKLDHLSLEGNKLTTLPENIFINQKELRSLYLIKNQITFLPPNIFKSLISLKDLQISFNKIKILHPEWFVNLQNLRTFFATNNEISDLPKDVFSSLESLEYLYLDSNQLTTIHSDSFGHIQKLSWISFNDNKINAIDAKIIENTSADRFEMNANVCAVEFINLKKNSNKLKKCFENYQPREE
ncbi:hypothetical protein ACKWTF_004608 [Chironomus riparius]